MVKFGCIDIAMEVLLLLSYTPLPGEGYKDGAMHIMEYLELQHNPHFCMDPTYLYIDYEQIPVMDWKELQQNSQKPFCKPVYTFMFFDSNNAEDKQTRCSCSGIIIYIYTVFIGWCSSHQSMIETGVFGADSGSLAIKKGVWYTYRDLRYQLRMMVDIDRAAHAYAEYSSIMKNITMPQSTCNEKDNVVWNHRVSEPVDMGKIRTMHIPGIENLDDLIKKFCCEAPSICSM